MRKYSYKGSLNNPCLMVGVIEKKHNNEIQLR